MRRPGSVLVVADMAAKDYLDQRWQVLAFADAPRILLEVGFLVLLGRFLAGPGGAEVALVGASAYVIAISTVSRIANAYLVDVEFDTVDEVRLGRLPLLAIAAIRGWVWIAEGLAHALLSVLVVGPLAVGWARTGQLLALGPVYLLVALTTACLGLAAGAVSLGRRWGGLLGNLSVSVLLLCCGVVTANGPGVAALRWALPLGRGIQALRAGPSDQRFIPLVRGEVAVGLAWLGVAAVAVAVLQRRLRVRGIVA